MLKLSSILFAALLVVGCGGTGKRGSYSLKESVGDKFLMGVAINTRQAAGADTAATRVVRQHYNSVVAENCMKSMYLQPEEGRFVFDEADQFVQYAKDNQLHMVGHCLIWHSQLPEWFCVDKQGRDVSPEVLKERMRNHIHTVVGRYKGVISGWDVVNEAIEDDGSWRNSKFYQILGEEFIELAFRYAHEADPGAELYYNDYNMFHEGKRNRVVQMVNNLKAKGVRIDAVGMQGHMGMDYPLVSDFENSITAFASAGVNVMVTEWDMTALPSPQRGANVSDTVAYNKAINPYIDGLPEEVLAQWNKRMKRFFDLFVKHAEVITRVTLWGVADGDSWKNDFPVRGRTDYALPFDRDYRPKGFVREIVAPQKATFHSMIYEVKSEEEVKSEGDDTLENPILPGCFPDPSICRVGEDYYLVNSSFAYYPAIPIWHSRDLREWTQLGYVLNRPSQFRFADDIRIREGIYAPDLKYNPHDKLFYLITTSVNGGGNFFVTTPDPKSGQWSDPVYLPEVGGIDPGIFFDNDGKAYIVNNDAPDGKPRYEGHRAIWMREFDWRNGRTIGQQRVIVDGGVDIRQKPIWIEAPHLYYINNTYYLMCAEGGTSTQHSEVVFSSRSAWGPFKPCAVNPILTQRDLPEDRANPVTCAGHADLVQTPEGDWWAVFLAVRPYRENHDMMGRETFILPVRWESDQPIILDAGETIHYNRDYSYPATPLWSKGGLANEAFFIRVPQRTAYTILTDGKLELNASSNTIDERAHPSFIGRWVNAWNFTTTTSLDFTPTGDADFAGLVCFQDETCYVRFGKGWDEQTQAPAVILEVVSKEVVVQRQLLPLAGKDASETLSLKVQGEPEAKLQFSYRFSDREEWQALSEAVNADYLSTATSGGFTGLAVGVYATAQYFTPQQ